MRAPEISRFANVPNEPGKYVYRIKSTNRSSAELGPCEACGGYCSEVFHQVEGRTYLEPGTLDPKFVGPPRLAITYHECKNLFGHEECLKSARR